MKETLRDLKERRSCRAYLPEQIREEALTAILEAGTYAPTGMGRQSPVIVAVQDPETRNALSRMNAAVMGASGDPFYGAPCVIVVLSDPERMTWVEDGSLVLGNLMNAAHSLGLGSCWIHRAKECFDTPEGKALLRAWGVPENYRGVGNCILGYAAEEPEAKPRKSGRIIKI